jgi:hypothetical protein
MEIFPIPPLQPARCFQRVGCPPPPTIFFLVRSVVIYLHVTVEYTAWRHCRERNKTDVEKNPKFGILLNAFQGCILDNLDTVSTSSSTVLLYVS